MEKQITDIESRLKAAISKYESAVVAFSGGVDSTLLAYATRQVLGDKMLAVTAISPSFPSFQLEDAKTFAREWDIPIEFINTKEMDNEDYRKNSPDRCYHCKTELFTKCEEVASAKGFQHIFDGCNIDDHSDYRPGLKAAKEQRICSPLAEASMGKEDIRTLSRHYGLPTWDMPAFACLASRLPYGESINPEKLDKIEQAESVLRAAGFRQYRVRYHDTVARIELDPDEMPKAMNMETFKQISTGIKKAGFTFVALDMDGYSTGSLNRLIKNS